MLISDFVILILLTETRCDNVGKQSKEGQVFNLPLLVNVKLDYVTKLLFMFIYWTILFFVILLDPTGSLDFTKLVSH